MKYHTCPRCGRRARIDITRKAFPHTVACAIGRKLRERRRREAEATGFDVDDYYPSRYR